MVRGVKGYSPNPQTSTFVGDRYQYVCEIINAAFDNANYLDDFEYEFVEDQMNRLQQFRDRTKFTLKQWGVITRLQKKLEDKGVL